MSETVNFSTLLARSAAGLFSGILGTFVLGVVLLLSWSAIGGFISGSEELVFNPIVITIVTLGVFLSCLTSSLAYVVLLGAFDNRYRLKSTAFTHVFFGNLVLLLAFLVIFFTAYARFNVYGLSLISIAYLIATALFTYFVLEFVHHRSTLLVKLYGFLGVLVFFFFITFAFSSTSPVFLLTIMPLFYGIMAFASTIVEMFYDWLRGVYQNDFLDLEKRYGEDYGKSAAEQKKAKEKAFDEDEYLRDL